MPKRKPKGKQLDTIPRLGDLFQASFNLNNQDQFATGLGVQFIHYKAMPSPIGLKERGDYRRSDSLDTISSNGMLYTASGCFTATMIGNSRKNRLPGGLVDDSVSRLVMPRFYDKGEGVAEGDRIYLSPGDRVYIADKDADVKVVNFQRMEFEPGRDNEPMFPICQIEFITCSKGKKYEENRDFEITQEGNIRWLSSGDNPGVDPDTKKGRIYSVRYLYRAFWYILELPNEVRVTNVTTEGVRAPERMAYHAVIQREYVYHNQIRGKAPASNEDNKTQRTRQEPRQSLDPNSPKIKVNVADFSEEDQE